jgi:hypothetical protein
VNEETQRGNEVAIMSTRVTIYMPMLDEGTVVYRPVSAETSAGLIYRILPPENGMPEGENWRFAPGTFVKCERQILGGKAALVAKQQVDL